jgi:hypothetical protein
MSATSFFNSVCYLDHTKNFSSGHLVPEILSQISSKVFDKTAAFVSEGRSRGLNLIYLPGVVGPAPRSA